ncbi:MAG TPA: hypothetical protein PLM63_03910, partial [bacterium]|nr:hypothetical protein [bacterium]
MAQSIFDIVSWNKRKDYYKGLKDSKGNSFDDAIVNLYTEYDYNRYRSTAKKYPSISIDNISPLNPEKDKIEQKDLDLLKSSMSQNNFYSDYNQRKAKNIVFAPVEQLTEDKEKNKNIIEPELFKEAYESIKLFEPKLDDNERIKIAKSMAIEKKIDKNYVFDKANYNKEKQFVLANLQNYNIQEYIIQGISFISDKERREKDIKISPFESYIDKTGNLNYKVRKKESSLLNNVLNFLGLGEQEYSMVEAYRNLTEEQKKKYANRGINVGLLIADGQTILQGLDEALEDEEFATDLAKSYISSLKKKGENYNNQNYTTKFFDNVTLGLLETAKMINPLGLFEPVENTESLYRTTLDELQLYAIYSNDSPKEKRKFIKDTQNNLDDKLMQTARGISSSMMFFAASFLLGASGATKSYLAKLGHGFIKGVALGAPTGIKNYLTSPHIYSDASIYEKGLHLVNEGFIAPGIELMSEEVFGNWMLGKQIKQGVTKTLLNFGFNFLQEEGEELISQAIDDIIMRNPKEWTSFLGAFTGSNQWQRAQEISAYTILGSTLLFGGAGTVRNIMYKNQLSKETTDTILDSLEKSIYKISPNIINRLTNDMLASDKIGKINEINQLIVVANMLSNQQGVKGDTKTKIFMGLSTLVSELEKEGKTKLAKRISDLFELNSEDTTKFDDIFTEIEAGIFKQATELTEKLNKKGIQVNQAMAESLLMGETFEDYAMANNIDKDNVEEKNKYENLYSQEQQETIDNYSTKIESIKKELEAINKNSNLQEEEKNLLLAIKNLELQNIEKTKTIIEEKIEKKEIGSGITALIKTLENINLDKFISINDEVQKDVLGDLLDLKNEEIEILLKTKKIKGLDFAKKLNILEKIAVNPEMGYYQLKAMSLLNSWYSYSENEEGMKGLKSKFRHNYKKIRVAEYQNAKTDFDKKMRFNVNVFKANSSTISDLVEEIEAEEIDNIIEELESINVSKLKDNNKESIDKLDEISKNKLNKLVDKAIDKKTKKGYKIVEQIDKNEINNPKILTRQTIIDNIISTIKNIQSERKVFNESRKTVSKKREKKTRRGTVNNANKEKSSITFENYKEITDLLGNVFKALEIPIYDKGKFDEIFNGIDINVTNWFILYLNNNLFSHSSKKEKLNFVTPYGVKDKKELDEILELDFLHTNFLKIIENWYFNEMSPMQFINLLKNGHTNENINKIIQEIKSIINTNDSKKMKELAIKYYREATKLTSEDEIKIAEDMNTGNVLIFNPFEKQIDKDPSTILMAFSNYLAYSLRKFGEVPASNVGSKKDTSKKPDTSTNITPEDIDKQIDDIKEDKETSEEDKENEIKNLEKIKNKVKNQENLDETELSKVEKSQEVEKVLDEIKSITKKMVSNSEINIDSLNKIYKLLETIVYRVESGTNLSNHSKRFLKKLAKFIYDFRTIKTPSNIEVIISKSIGVWLRNNLTDKQWKDFNNYEKTELFITQKFNDINKSFNEIVNKIDEEGNEIEQGKLFSIMAKRLSIPILPYDIFNSLDVSTDNDFRRFLSILSAMIVTEDADFNKIINYINKGRFNDFTETNANLLIKYNWFLQKYKTEIREYFNLIVNNGLIWGGISTAKNDIDTAKANMDKLYDVLINYTPKGDKVSKTQLEKVKLYKRIGEIFQNNVLTTNFINLLEGEITEEFTNSLNKIINENVKDENEKLELYHLIEGKGFSIAVNNLQDYQLEDIQNLSIDLLGENNQPKIEYKTVKEDKNLKNSYGYYNKDTNTIVVNLNKKEKDQKETIIHETIHHIFNNIYDENNQEVNKEIHAISNNFLSVFSTINNAILKYFDSTQIEVLVKAGRIKNKEKFIDSLSKSGIITNEIIDLLNFDELKTILGDILITNNINIFTNYYNNSTNIKELKLVLKNLFAVDNPTSIINELTNGDYEKLLNLSRNTSIEGYILKTEFSKEIKDFNNKKFFNETLAIFYERNEILRFFNFVRSSTQRNNQQVKHSLLYEIVLKLKKILDKLITNKSLATDIHYTFDMMINSFLAKNNLPPIDIVNTNNITVNKDTSNSSLEADSDVIDKRLTNNIDTVKNILVEEIIRLGNYQNEETKKYIRKNYLNGSLPLLLKQLVQIAYDNLRKANYSISDTDVDIEKQTLLTNQYIKEVRDENNWHYRMSNNFSGYKSDIRFSLNINGDQEIIDKLDAIVDKYNIYYKTPATREGWSDTHDPITIYLNSAELTEEQLKELKQEVVNVMSPF